MGTRYKTKKEIDVGVEEYYVNVNAKCKNKRQSSLFKMMTKINYYDEEEFPELSKEKEIVNSLNLGGNNMVYHDFSLEIFKDGKKIGREEGMEKGMEKGQLSTLSRLIKKGIITIKDAASELGMTERTFKKKMAML